MSTMVTELAEVRATPTHYHLLDTRNKQSFITKIMSLLMKIMSLLMKIMILSMKITILSMKITILSMKITILVTTAYIFTCVGVARNSASSVTIVDIALAVI
ncbi:MAG: hypothetical protein V7K61_20000 [Nostoc sp.]